ncbi:MAG: hypothetical protein KAH38_08880 [Candidatus Hydrogenedentes bacterium]|nr:hypothetical protein [Candidatus Hydrogenedentota bacterium]
MIPTLGEYALDSWHVTIVEKQRYNNGRWHRNILIRGSADTFESTTQLTEALDLLAAAPFASDPVALRLRPGRSAAVRLRGFERTRCDNAVAGAFTLELEGVTPWEESDTSQSYEAPVTGNGLVCEITSGASLASPLSLTFTAAGMVLLPRFGDGTRTLLYAGILPNESILQINSAAGKVFLDGEDVSSQVSGSFLQTTPRTTEISFEADAEGTQTGTLQLSWRERWL